MIVIIFPIDITLFDLDAVIHNTSGETTVNIHYIMVGVLNIYRRLY